MLIVEGPDGSGKTTLVNLLKAELGVGVAPRVVSKDTEAMVDLRGWVDHNLDTGLVPTIFDRHRLISEPIYGPIMRDDAEPGFDTLSWLAPRMKRFYELRPFIIYCLPPLSVVLENLKGDPDNIAIVDRAERIYQSYVSRISLDLEFAPRTPMVWDYTNSLRMKSGHPIFMSALKYYTNHLLTEKVETTW